MFAKPYFPSLRIANAWGVVWKREIEKAANGVKVGKLYYKRTNGCVRQVCVERRSTQGYYSAGALRYNFIRFFYALLRGLTVREGRRNPPFLPS